MLEYETANPGQDLDDKEAQVFNPEVSTERPNVSAAPVDYHAQADGKIQPAGDRQNSRDQGSRDQGSKDQGRNAMPREDRSHSQATNAAQPDRSRHGRRSRDNTHPAADGTADYNYRSSHDSYRRGPDVESGRYASRSAGRH